MTEEKPYRIAISGAGKLGDLSATYTTLMEFDGLIRGRLTLTPPSDGASLSSLVLEIPLAAEVAAVLPQSRMPALGREVARRAGVPALRLARQRGAGLVVVHGVGRQLADAARAEPAMTFRREGRLRRGRGCTSSASRSRVEKPLTYTIRLRADAGPATVAAAVRLAVRLRSADPRA